jgi:mRNA interferase MazF
VRRGEVWWARLRAPKGSRPVLLLSRDSAYGRRTHITVAPLTRAARSIQTEVALSTANDGVPTDSVVNLDDIETIPARWLDRRIATLSAQKMDDVNRAIRFALDLG